MKVKDIVEALDVIAPFDGACDWDNCGLMCGDLDDGVSRVLVTLDADMYALELALKHQCTAVVSHHPLIFDGLRSVTAAHPVYSYIKNGIAVISVHTCLDAADGGINDLLAQAALIQDPQKLYMDGCALGRYGIAECKDPYEYIDAIKSRLPSNRADYLLSRPIKRAAVVSGSGGSAIELLKTYDCDTLITGEAKHDHFLYAQNNGLNLITLGHFETENIIIEPLVSKLSQILVQTEFIGSDRTKFIKRR